MAREKSVSGAALAARHRPGIPYLPVWNGQGAVGSYPGVARSSCTWTSQTRRSRGLSRNRRSHSVQLARHWSSEQSRDPHVSSSPKPKSSAVRHAGVSNVTGCAKPPGCSLAEDHAVVAQASARTRTISTLARPPFMASDSGRLPCA